MSAEHSERSLALDPGRPTSATRSTATSGIWAGDELLRRRLDRAAARPGASSRSPRCRSRSRIDFEGDQWTFFKFPHADLLRALRPRRAGAGDLAAAGRRTSTSRWRRAGRCSSSSIRSTCPTPPGTAYQRAHVKSTVAVNEIDVASRRLGYFHNAGLLPAAGRRFRATSSG